jgi:flavin reductase (DIM6/NTAB) family NADH-FMN oxidoreductase RutF
MLSLNMDQLSLAQRQDYLQHAVGPRPICFASTLDEEGRVNLSPFSFFNLFSIEPPILVFSPSRRMRDNTVKHTLENIRQVPEVVINLVDFAMVQQTSLASCEYPKGVSEFIKAGFTPIPSGRVRPPRVAESKISMECHVREIKSLGSEGGAGNLVICEVLCLHVQESILNSERRIDQRKMQHVARLGGNWYCRVDETNLFEVEKPNRHLGMGIDQLPENIRESRWLTGNHLGALANLTERPGIDPGFEDERLRQIIQYFSSSPGEMEKELHIYAGELLDQGRIPDAWQVLLTLI